MAQDDSALREVDRSLAEERQMELFRKRGPILITGAAAIVLAVGGWQFWNYQKTQAAANAAADYHAAMTALSSDPEAGRRALAAFAQDAPSGYAVLARMRSAAELANSGEREAAISAYRLVADDSGAARRLRELARLRAAYLALDDGRDAVLAILGNLTESQSVFGYYARELSGVAALDHGDYEMARQMFVRAAADVNTPEGIRLRAEEFAALASAGRAGVRLDTRLRSEDLLRAIEGAGHDQDHDHDHDHDAHDDHGHEDAYDAANEGPAPAIATDPGEIDSEETGQDE